MNKLLKAGLLLFLACIGTVQAQQKQDTIVVARDGTGEYRTIQEAVEAVRAFMDYTVTIYIKDGLYKEKLVIPSWVKNVQLVGESAEGTIITYDDHANIDKMGTFRTYTVKVEGNDITFKNLTIENNAAPLGQAVALHTEGDRLMFIHCRLLGNQDTIYTGREGTRRLFTDCYIEGTTDFIFGSHIRPEGWDNWRNKENEKTARYAEFGNTGEGAATAGRVKWAKQLTSKEALRYTIENIFTDSSNWYPYKR